MLEEIFENPKLAEILINDWLISDSRLGRYRLAYLDHSAHLTWFIRAHLAYMSACAFYCSSSSQCQ